MYFIFTKKFKTTRLPYPTALVLVLFGIFNPMNNLQAGYGTLSTQAPSNVDPSVVAISEADYLGVKVGRKYVLHEATGKEFTLGELLTKPLLLNFSYYGCDGACPTANKTLQRTLAQVKNWKIGKDYNVLTLSFDKKDTSKSLNDFLAHTKLKNNIPDGWKIATFKNPEEIKELTQSLGFKFFWDPRDQVFLHPSVYFIMSTEGRVTRMLYPQSITAEDVELAITKAYGNELTVSPKNMINLLVSTCFSYNYKDGKYSLNYPMFIAWGALIFGFLFLIGGSLAMKRRVKI